MSEPTCPLCGMGPNHFGKLHPKNGVACLREQLRWAKYCNAVMQQHRNEYNSALVTFDVGYLGQDYLLGGADALRRAKQMQDQLRDICTALACEPAEAVAAIEAIKRQRDTTGMHNIELSHALELICRELNCEPAEAVERVRALESDAKLGRMVRRLIDKCRPASIDIGSRGCKSVVTRRGGMFYRDTVEEALDAALCGLEEVSHVPTGHNAV